MRKLFLPTKIRLMRLVSITRLYLFGACFYSANLVNSVQRKYLEGSNKREKQSPNNAFPFRCDFFSPIFSKQRIFSNLGII